MKRIALVAILAVAGSVAWGVGKETDDLRPIPAAEAERRVAETRDFIGDLIWVHIDTYWHDGKWEDCMRLSRMNIELDPHFTEAYTNLAWLLANLDRDAEAIAVYREGIEANPGQYDIHHQFGMFYSRRHRYQEAVEQFRKSVANGAPQTWQHMLPSTLAKSGRKQEALSEWRALLKRFPGDVVAQHHIKSLETELRGKSGDGAE